MHRRMFQIAWWFGLLTASVLLPFVGGLAVVAVTRLRFLRKNSPSTRAMLIVWTVISVLQVAALFLTQGLSHSTDVVVG